MSVTLPYASPRLGAVSDQDWSSIHSSPPWEDTDIPAIVRNDFGAGRAIYSAADIECVDAEGNDRLFLSLLRSMIREPASFEAATHPAVWMTVFHQPEKNRFVVSFLNYQAQLPPVPIAAIPFRLRVPDGNRFTRLLLLPEETAVPFVTEEDGTLRADARDVAEFQMLAAEYE